MRAKVLPTSLLTSCCFMSLIARCRPLWDLICATFRTGQPAGALKLLRLRAMAFETVSLFLSAVFESERSAGNNRPSCSSGHSHLSPTFILPLQPNPRTRCTLMPSSLKRLKVEKAAQLIVFVIAACPFREEMATTLCSKSKSLAFKRRTSVMRQQSK